MSKKTRPYRDLRLERLAKPEVAAHYLNATRQNSPSELLNALKNVAKAHQMAKVAKDSGLQRETLYRSLSEQGNPTWDTLSAVLAAVGLNVIFAAVGTSVVESPNPAPPIVSKPTMTEEPKNPLDSVEQIWSSPNPLWGGSANTFAQQGAQI
jgi:probable addiction module antidote protein